VWILEFPISARSYERIGTDKLAALQRLVDHWWRVYLY
jgi:hypothetical protein